MDSEASGYEQQHPPPYMHFNMARAVQGRASPDRSSSGASHGHAHGLAALQGLKQEPHDNQHLQQQQLAFQQLQRQQQAYQQPQQARSA